ncbi:MAG: helix-turn-helix domain-containing protein [Clostridia bacterium]|nr:helix-turn-helix domain-containing protein [Clostridia bacterium]
MFYENELRLLRETFWKCHLQTQLIDPHAPLTPAVDMGLRQLLGREGEYARSFYELAVPAQPNTIYRFADPFFCHYLYFRLPDMTQECVFVLGPYLTEELTPEALLERAEALGVNPRESREWEHYYGGVPLLPENNYLFSMMDAFGEHIWGGSGSFTVVDVTGNAEEELLLFSASEDAVSADNMAWKMQMMEQRYAYENELMRAVEYGQSHKAEMLLERFSLLSFERRLADPLRNLKNYCIIMNTLLRKAAEKGGVHPVYLDDVSSAFARKIETLPSTAMVQELMTEMFRSYCRLVRKHSMKQYSPLVQKMIACIDSDLTADLSLHTLAAMQNVSAGYLSTLFRRETGQTLTDYVNGKRIGLAKQLLRTTKLQIQTVAQHCGIWDVHYFSRLFKKQTGQTPKEFRESGEY